MDIFSDAKLGNSKWKETDRNHPEYCLHSNECMTLREPRISITCPIINKLQLANGTGMFLKNCIFGHDKQ